MNEHPSEEPANKPHKLTYANPTDPWHRKLAIGLIEYVFGGRGKLQRYYREIQSTSMEAGEIWKAALDKLRITLDYDAAQLAKIPDEGPVVVIANHPFGVVDGLILGHIIYQIRREYVILVNEVLTRQDPRLAPFLLPIDFRETPEAARTNVMSGREATDRLKQGQVLGIFPSGAVATAKKPFRGKAEDWEWKRFTAKVIQQAKATVVPMYVHGQNSWLFHLASKISPTFRLATLLHEVRNKKGDRIKISIGDPIPYADLAHLKDRQQLMDHLRQITFRLADASKS